VNCVSIATAGVKAQNSLTLARMNSLSCARIASAVLGSAPLLTSCKSSLSSSFNAVVSTLLLRLLIITGVSRPMILAAALYN
jgi:hypothetical protein